MQVKEKQQAGKRKDVARYEKVVTFGASCLGLARCRALWEEVVRLGGLNFQIKSKFTEGKLEVAKNSLFSL